MAGPSWQAFAELASAPMTMTIWGRVSIPETGEAEYVTFAPPDLWRIEDGAGHLRYLADETGLYQYPAGGGPIACFTERDPHAWSSGGMQSPALIRPRNLVGPEDGDFTRPLGDVQDAVHLGRRAWRVTLAPPAHKPAPVVQVLDVASGATLAYETVDGALVIGFTEFEAGGALEAETFAAPA